VSYAGVWPGQARLSLPEFIRKAANLGFSAVMLMAKRPHLSVLDYGPRACAEIRELMEEAGVRCRVIAGYNNFGADPEHGDIPHREIQIRYITDLARMAQDLGAGVVRIFTSYEHPSVGYAALWESTLDAIRECSRRAADYGVTIGVQNHHDLAAHYESQFDLVQAVGEANCKAIFDAWAPALHGTDLAQAARKMAPITCHTTVADYQPRPRFRYHSSVINYERQAAWMQAVPMGEGFINYPEFFREMRAGGYGGDVAYEMCSPLMGGGAMENLDCYAHRFLAWLRIIENLQRPDKSK
jgi:sugar phosphate isomerase/epimerase